MFALAERMCPSDRKNGWDLSLVTTKMGVHIKRVSTIRDLIVVFSCHERVKLKACMCFHPIQYLK